MKTTNTETDRRFTIGSDLPNNRIHLSAITVFSALQLLEELPQFGDCKLSDEAIESITTVKDRIILEVS